ITIAIAVPIRLPPKIRTQASSPSPRCESRTVTSANQNFESCLPDRVTVADTISPPRPGRMYAALVDDLHDAREGLTGRVGDVASAGGSRPADPVVELLGPRPERFPHYDAADRPHGLVRHPVGAMDPVHGERA